MLEQVYDTLFAILRYELSANGTRKPAINDKQITGWLTGDQTELPNVPAIILQSAGASPEDLAQNLITYEYKIKITFKVANGDTTLSERDTQEFARQIREALLPHRRMWVMTKCPFDGKSMLSPQHYTSAHSAVLAPYVTAAQNFFAAQFSETHSVGTSLPALDPDGVAVLAFQLMYQDVQAGTPVSGMSDDVKEIFQEMQARKFRPIRLLSKVKVSEFEPSTDDKEQNLLRGGELMLTATEIIRQPAYGPGNVPNSAAVIRQI